MIMELILASNNQGKLREIQAILEPYGIKVRTAAQAGFTEDIEETGKTFEENARLKALTVARALNLPALADDSGLVVEALGGEPGVYSARYSGPGATDKSNNAKLLDAMEGAPPEKRAAAFMCVMVCCKPGGESIMAQGRFQGRIAEQPAGQSGFGYDPLFEIPDLGRTAAQLSPEEKNAISHRGKALADLMKRLPQFLNG